MVKSLDENPSWFDLPDLGNHVWQLISQIPAGKVTTFGALAHALGDRQAARWVASYVKQRLSSRMIPAHRIVYADGRVSDSVSSQLLKQEGIALVDNRVDLARYFFAPSLPIPPLKVLSEWQRMVAHRIHYAPCPVPRLVAGFDLSYQSSMKAIATGILWSVDQQRLIESYSIIYEVTFPYISGYLGFRELPALLALIDRYPVLIDAEVWLVDGSGLLHPRHCGIAVMLGIMANHPTIGIAKHLLCGQVRPSMLIDDSNLGERFVIESIYHKDDQVPAGVCMARRIQEQNRVYVSTGHCLDLSSATRITAAVWQHQRYPDPIWWADHLSHQPSKNR